MPLSSLFLHVTNACNFRCTHCYTDSGFTNEGELTTDEIIRVYDEAFDLGVKRVHLDGGECLLRPDVFDIVDHAYTRGLPVSIVTNGSLLNEIRVVRLKDRISTIGISIDGFRPETHDAIRESGSHSAAIRAVRLAKEAGIPVRVWMTVSAMNIREAVGLLKYLDDLGVDMVGFYHCSPVGRGYENAEKLQVEPAQWVRFCHDIENERRKRSIKVIYEPAYEMEELPEQRCECGVKGRQTCHVDSTGNVHFCGLPMARDYLPLGNIRVSPLAEILETSPGWKRWEDIYHASSVMTGGLENADRCSCPAISVDPNTGQVGPDPRTGGTYLPVCVVAFYPQEVRTGCSQADPEKYFVPAKHGDRLHSNDSASTTG